MTIGNDVLKFKVSAPFDDALERSRIISTLTRQRRDPGFEIVQAQVRSAGRNPSGGLRMSVVPLRRLLSLLLSLLRPQRQCASDHVHG